MNAELLRRDIANTIFEKLSEVRKKGDGWYTAANFLLDYILPSNEWAPDPNIIAYIEIAIRDIKAGIRQEKTAFNPRTELVEEMQSSLKKLVSYLRSNGFGMLESAKGD